MAQTLNSKTANRYRKLGWQVAFVETWNHYGGMRRDLFGFADLLAIREGFPGVLAIQVTSTANHAARRRKILASPLSKIWLAAGNEIELVSWYPAKSAKLLRVEFFSASGNYSNDAAKESSANRRSRQPRVPAAAR